MKIRWLFVGLASLLPNALRAAPDAPSRPGADLPWVTYEAEDATTNGARLGPDYTGHTPAREASGRMCVQLSRLGDYVEFTATTDAQGLIIRYCIPDSTDGRGIDATLSLYLNGHRSRKILLTSRYTHLYGNYPFSKQPGSGSPRHFWDEARLMPGAIHRGDKIRLQKDKEDSAANYLIDLVDLETVPPAIEQPAGSLSIVEMGAASDGSSDARPACVAAIAKARQEHRSVWIPAGTFLIKGPVEVSDIAIEGAGMWYSTLVGADDYAPANRLAIAGVGGNVSLADFAIIGKLRYRNDSEPNDGIVGSFGAHSTMRNLWVEHTKTGAWLTNSDGLTIQGCRFRDTIADGINLCVGMRNTTVRNCTARGTGDDCFAVWPAAYAEALYPPGGNRIVHCTAQLPFLAQGFSIYGGDGNSVEDCRAVDIPYGAGLFASTTFPTQSGFQGITSFRHIVLTRTGDRDGSIATVADKVDLAGLRFEDIQITDSPCDGIKFTSMNGHALNDTRFNMIRIINPGIGGAGFGIAEAPGAVGSATIRQVTVMNPKTAAVAGSAPGFKLIRENGESSLKVSERSVPGLPVERGAAAAP